MTTASSTNTVEAGAFTTPLRLGRIAYLNVFPMHWRLPEADVSGVPTDVNAALHNGDIDAACISSIEYARHADELVLLPSLCVSADGAVGSIFLIANAPLEEIATVWTTPASATSATLLRTIFALQHHSATITAMDAGASPMELLATPGTAVLLIGDEAMQARDDDALRDFTFTDLGELWRDHADAPMVYAVWAVRRDALTENASAAQELDELLSESIEHFSASHEGVAAASAAYGIDELAARAYLDRLTYTFGERERAALRTFFAAARDAGEIGAVPELVFATDVAPITLEQYGEAVGVRSALTRVLPEDEAQAAACLELEADARAIDIDDVLTKALAGTRISDVEAVALLQSDRLIDIGQVAHEVRLRTSNPNEVTFIVDRNINYTNYCVTDCGFCAFYRRPGAGADGGGYLHSTQVILDKIRETIELGGTAALMQGGHNPDLGIEWYVDLFTAIKNEYPTFHLHALSPPEIQHIARRSKMTIGETLATLRDAGLDSLPGGGGEVLVDRVRRIIAPKKTKTDDWLGVMREAHRIGMSTSASMMYGHVELLAERVEHMRRIRDLQDEAPGFRAFISWTFQPGDTPLARLLASKSAPYAADLPTSPTPFTYLLTQAVSRIYLDNVDHIQSSWVTQGLKVGQVALDYGADDLGSIMIEENVVSSAGTTYRATVEDFVANIRAAGYTPVQRDTLYRTVQTYS